MVSDCEIMQAEIDIGIRVLVPVLHTVQICENEGIKNIKI